FNQLFQSVRSVAFLRHAAVQQLSTAPAPSAMASHSMRSVNSYEYGGLEKLQLTDTMKVPVLRQPDDILVRVHCSTVQPIDIALLSGYGSVLLPLAARAAACGAEPDAVPPALPLILGRDFCGEVVAAGPDCPPELRQPGRLVWGARAPFESGCHAEFALASARHVRPVPDGVDPAAAACVPYPGLTALAAMLEAGLPTPASSFNWPLRCRSSRPDPAVLVLGASGGVGLLLLQLIRCLLPACRLVVTCPARHVADLPAAVNGCQLDSVLASGGHDSAATLQQLTAAPATFDAIIDLTRDAASRRRLLPTLRPGGRLATVSSPLLRLFDQRGVAGGAPVAARAFASDRAAGIRWAFFAQSGANLDYLARLLALGRLAPRIDRRFSMSGEFRTAFELAAGGDGRGMGRVVLDVAS
uniref:PKS_ER domain-containing protein n=2 Tax=Macrostomum lignano TaxID=282301 RepID=A0A1I8I4L7_9PLAT